MAASGTWGRRVASGSIFPNGRWQLTLAHHFIWGITPVALALTYPGQLPNFLSTVGIDQ